MSHDPGTSTGSREPTNRSASTTSRRRFLVGSAAAGATALAGCAGGGGSDTLTVGHVLPTSGTYALLGESIMNGFDLYLQQNDGQLGGYEVETVQRDTAGETDTGVTITNEFLVQEGVDALVGPVSSAVAIAMMQTVQQESSAIWLNANAGDYRVTQDGCMDLHFRTSFNDWQTSAPLAQWVYDNVADNVVLSYADYAFGQNSKNFFQEAFEEAGGEVVGEVAAPLGTDDYSPFLGDIESSGAEAVFSFFAGSDAVNYITQFNDFGLGDELTQTGSGFLLSEDTLPAQGEAALGKYSLLHYTATKETDRNQTFVSNYSGEFDRQPNVYACQGYDSAQALDIAASNADSTDASDLASALSGAQLDSPRGEFSFDPDTNEPLQSMDVREVVQGDDGVENEVVATIDDIELPDWGCSL